MSTSLLLTVAIRAEVIATSALKSSGSSTRLIPSILVVIGYALAFTCLSFTLKTLPLGVAYAIWSGAGTALVAMIGCIYYE